MSGQSGDNYHLFLEFLATVYVYSVDYFVSKKVYNNKYFECEISLTVWD